MRSNTKKIKICDFGAGLGIDDIIESVHYHKGGHNNRGDEPDDFVTIVLRDAKEIISEELEKAFKNHYKTVDIETYAGKDDKWVEYRISFKDSLFEDTDKRVGRSAIIEQDERDVIEKFGLVIRSVYTDFVTLEDKRE